MSNPKQARLAMFFACERRAENVEPPSESAVHVVPENQSHYEVGKTNDLGHVMELHSQLSDAEKSVFNV